MEHRQSVKVLEDLSDFFELLRSCGAAESRIFILADKSTSEHCLPLLSESLPGQGRNCVLLNVSDGEQRKSIVPALHLCERLLEYSADRHSVLINLGGGKICDLGGFVASIFKRGMRWINIPTTVLAQVDAAIGGKTGVNLMGYKNMLGTFQFPEHTVIHPGFLRTLPKREVLSGFAEMAKHAIIASPELWRAMLTAEYIDLKFIEARIGEAMEIKREIVARDFMEKGDRKQLNFGHTVGHALESFMMESPAAKLLHGEAVALGMMAETHISYQMGLVSEDVLIEISTFLAQNYQGVDIDENEYHRLIEIMRQDKKSNKDRLNMTLIRGIGLCEIDQEPTMDKVFDALTYVMRYPFDK